jgi:hypothetical protein
LRSAFELVDVGQILCASSNPQNSSKSGARSMKLLPEEFREHLETTLDTETGDHHAV